MNQLCLICNSLAVSLRNAINIFGEHAPLQSHKKLPDLISEIIDKPVSEDTVHTKVICKKCFKSCSEYDSLQVRVQSLKTEMQDQFKKTLPKHNIPYDTYGKEPISNTNVVDNTKKFQGKKIVLPASKLQPLPPDFLLKGNKWPLTSSTLNLKVTVGSSVLTQSIKTTGFSNTPIKINKPTNDLVISPTKLLDSSLNSDKVIVTSTYNNSFSKNSNSVFLDVNSLPKDFLSSAILTKIGDGDGLKVEGEQSDVENNDEQAMEIDEECSLSGVTTHVDSNAEIVFGVAEDKESEFDVSLLPCSTSDSQTDNNKLIYGKLQILNEGDDDDDEQTIVMDGNGSILRLVSGQKLMYGGSEISLVMPDDDHQGDDHDNGDSHDSNDESQIELQVSGDEETANAIIAAAQEQGGAFIKVESGEMFRVESVQSKTDDAEDPLDNQASQMVALTDVGLFRCLLCEKNGNNEEQCIGDATTIMYHLKTSHDARIYVCHICGQVNRKRSLHQQHVLENHPEKSNKLVTSSDKSKVHECQYCKKKYSSRSLLMEHINTHTGSRPYSCTVCDKTFASKYTHQSHLKTHLERPRPFKCDQCPKSFFTQQNLNQHQKTHSGVKDFVCNVCGKAFATQHNLEVHGVVHSGRKPFPCQHCGKAFARRAEVRDHMRIHTGERPFVCDICSASFTQRSNLHSHRRATHLDDKRYHCTHCPKKFKRRRLLDYHIKASHTGERPLKCEVCMATFVYPEHYKKHVRIHSGEKPYVCEICGKSFNSRDNRNTHRFVHSDKKPYECLTCGAGYMRKQLLYAHMNTRGHLAESIVVNQPRVQQIQENILVPSDQVVIEPAKIKPAKFTDNVSNIFTTEELKLEHLEKQVETNEIDGAKLLRAITDDDKLIFQDDNLDNSVKVQEVTAENGEMIRLIRVQLPNGDNGWVALNSCQIDT